MRSLREGYLAAPAASEAAADHPEEEVQVGAGKAKHPPAWTRYFRRLWRPFLNKAEKARIVAAIAEQEKKTTGEIHVHVIAWVGHEDILALAQRKFIELGLQQTEHRNGVLILVSHLDHQFAIWGDEALHDKAGQLLWEHAREVLITHYAERHYAEGIEACVCEVGKELALHFPKANGTELNQIPNEITESG